MIYLWLIPLFMLMAGPVTWVYCMDRYPAFGEWCRSNLCVPEDFDPR